MPKLFRYYGSCLVQLALVCNIVILDTSSRSLLYCHLKLLNPNISLLQLVMIIVSRSPLWYIRSNLQLHQHIKNMLQHHYVIEDVSD
jgi:uncharacterized protein YbaP (TraB family)